MVLKRTDGAFSGQILSYCITMNAWINHYMLLTYYVTSYNEEVISRNSGGIRVSAPNLNTLTLLSGALHYDSAASNHNLN